MVCEDSTQAHRRKLRSAALKAAKANDDVDLDANCATMGEKLNVKPGADLVVAIAVRDPSGRNYAPYSFPNPSLLQVGMNEAVNKPVLHRIDVIGGAVTGYKTPGAADYSGQWPNTWIYEPRHGDGAGGREEHERVGAAHVQLEQLEGREQRLPHDGLSAFAA